MCREEVRKKTPKKLNNILLLVDQSSGGDMSIVCRVRTSAFIIHTHFIRISAVKTIKIALVHVMWWSLPLLLLVCSRSFMIPMKFLCCSAQSNTKKPLFSGVCAGFKASAASSISWQSCEHDSRTTMKTRSSGGGISDDVKKLKTEVVV